MDFNGCYREIKMINNRQQSVDIFNFFLVFLAVLLGALVLASFSARIFAGNWLDVKAGDELPNILILAVAVTSLWTAVRRLSGDGTKKLLVAGFVLICLDVVLEIPLKKYSAVFPASGINKWFFIFGLLDFLGIFLVLAGFRNLNELIIKNESR